MNRKKLTFKLKVNHLADHSPVELRRLRGRRTSKKSEKQFSNAKPFIKTMKKTDLPTDINWRLFGKNSNKYFEESIIFTFLTFF